MSTSVRETDFALVRLPGSTVARALNRLISEETPETILEQALRRDFSGRIALVSSFGADSAVLLHMVAQIDPETPVLFLETGMLFPQTLRYQQELADQLGLRNVRLVRPDSRDLARDDPDGKLHGYAPDSCCALRKTRPLHRALAAFDAWITGRKRFQSAGRADLPVFEADNEGRIKINPLRDWDPRRVRNYMTTHGLPLHPLVNQGYPSIGCAPCTTPVKPGEDQRSGRWRGQEKSECGIHFENGRLVRRTA